jgi:LCP family protein required for cell wall assembly
VLRRTSRRVRQSVSLLQKLFIGALITILVTIAVAAGLFVFDRVRSTVAEADWLPGPTLESSMGTPLPGTPVLVPRAVWDGKERVNILALGVDQREYEEGPWRTDTMMVLTLDPVTMSGGMLSIPRDLWVPIPGYEEGRINTAHYLGDAYDYPGGGPALAVKTVQYNLGVPIHYYARINFAAFEELVNLIDGVDIVVEEDISDATYPCDDGPCYDPLYIEAGNHHMDGKMALRYARTRYSPGGDFDRAERQQQVIMAIFDRVTQLKMLPQLIAKAPSLWETLQGSIETNLRLDEIIALANLVEQIDPANIRSGVMDEHYTQFWTTPSGQQVLIPVRERMRELRDYLFTSEAPSPEVEDPAARLQEEAATVAVLNGTTAPGLAGRTSDYLIANGLQVGLTDNADLSDYAESLIIVYTGKNYTADYIANLLNLPQTAVVHGADDGADYDITVIVGADFVPPDDGIAPEAGAEEQPAAETPEAQ